MVGVEEMRWDAGGVDGRKRHGDTKKRYQPKRGQVKYHMTEGDE